MKVAVNTGALVESVLAELGAPWPERKLVVKLNTLPQCEGDPALLKQVWVNLLANALKYTRKRDSARIEIGAVVDGGTTVFSVSDDGVGFDMRYAHKLFGVFQRLHRAEDYEGTGVGLAIVQRIIQRHGGRIWVEAALDRGAVFSFTLSPGTRS
jgi:light-regulated signal transduction histidine kinase (bacteriophytochrome)